MAFTAISSRPVRRGAPPATVGLLLFAGGASTTFDVQWPDPKLPPHPLCGVRVMAECEAQDLAIQRLCQDRFCRGVGHTRRALLAQ